MSTPLLSSVKSDFRILLILQVFVLQIYYNKALSRQEQDTDGEARGQVS